MNKIFYKKTLLHLLQNVVLQVKFSSFLSKVALITAIHYGMPFSSWECTDVIVQVFHKIIIFGICSDSICHHTVTVKLL